MNLSVPVLVQVLFMCADLFVCAILHECCAAEEDVSTDSMHTECYHLNLQTLL